MISVFIVFKEFDTNENDCIGIDIVINHSSPQSMIPKKNFPRSPKLNLIPTLSRIPKNARQSLYPSYCPVYIESII